MFLKPHRDFIVKSGGKFQVKSHAGKVLGEHKTRAEALAQLRAVEYNKHKNDYPASMGQLELPRGGDYQTESIGTQPPEADGGNGPIPDAAGARVGGTDPGLNSDPLQPHELPERRSNPHHAPDPLREREANGEPIGEKRYMEVEHDVAGSPGTSDLGEKEWPEQKPFDVAKLDEPGSPGANDLGEKEWPECDPLSDLRAAERIGEPKADQPGRPEREQFNAPAQAMRNGDPAPNPSAELTVKATAANKPGAALFQQPDESPMVDEGDPEQYEMASTESRLHANEGNEPGYYEQVSGSNGGPDNAYSKTDPAGDDDFLHAIGAGPTKNGDLDGQEDL